MKVSLKVPVVCPFEIPAIAKIVKNAAKIIVRFILIPPLIFVGAFAAQ